MDCEEVVYSNDYYDVIAEYTSVNRYESVTRCLQKISDVYDILYTQRIKSPPLSIEKYSYMAIPKCFTLLNKQALEVSGILRVQNYPTLSLKGQGVLMGFIDTGIDYENKVFQNADGSSRIAAIWDQTQRSGTPPKEFIYGSEYRQQQINNALNQQNPSTIVPSTDSNGHGTYIASIAAGSERGEADFIGAAPYSQIAMVKLKDAKEYLKEFFFIPKDALAYQENDIMAGIAYLNKLADELHMPLVLCFCMGSNLGSHSGVGSPATAMLDTLALRQQRAVVLAAGNEGNQRHHFYGQIQPDQQYQNVEISVGTGVTGFILEMWARAPELFVVEIVSPTGERVPKEYILSGGHEYTFLFEDTKVSFDYRVSGFSSGDQLIFMRFTNPIQGIWNIRVYRQLAEIGVFQMWLPMSELATGEIYFIRSSPDLTITVPANSSLPMTVTAYDARDNSLYINASRGYTTTGIVKPDFAAPGVEVYGAGLRNQFVTRSGTSGAAAVAAGACALLLEWMVVRGNFSIVTNTELKNIFMRSADKDSGRLYPNRDWGYGRLNVYRAFEMFRLY